MPSAVSQQTRLLVLLNAKAGATNSPDQTAIENAFRSHGIDAEVRPLSGHELTDAARSAIPSGYRAIVAAGGDGTISSIASILAGSDVPLGVLPLGTLNHFAKDLRIPFDLAGATRVIADGVVRPIDVAQVNDRTFINNSSIGIYPRIVLKRDQQIERLGRGKWLALVFAVLSLFRRMPQLSVRMATADQTILRRTPFVFVGNNEYHLSAFNLGSRTSLDRAQLCLYFTNRTGKFGMLRLAIRALAGRLNQAKDFNAMCVTEVWIDSKKPRLHVSADGELLTLDSPLHYRVIPKALNVIVPKSNDE